MDRLQPLLANGRFVNPAVTQPLKNPTFKDFRRWRRERKKDWKEDPADLPRVAPPTRLPEPPAAGIRATWVGHSTVVLQLDGRTYLTDPVWSTRIARVLKRRTAPGIPMSALPKLDALVISHDHYDHLDAPTIARIPRSTPVFVPTGVASFFTSRGFTDVRERSWWESVEFDGHTLTCVPAQHFSGRLPWTRDRTLWCGWVVEGTRSKAYYAGDSGWFVGFDQIGDAFPGLDLAMIPIGAYEPRWFMSPVHVDPPEAARAFAATRARRMLPVHWGTFRLADETIDEPMRALKHVWAKMGLADEALLRMRLGESFVV